MAASQKGLALYAAAVRSPKMPVLAEITREEMQMFPEASALLGAIHSTQENIGRAVLETRPLIEKPTVDCDAEARRRIINVQDGGFAM